MKEQNRTTWFAPAKRSNIEIIRNQAAYFTADSLLVHTMDAVSTAVLILNSDRQLVFANNFFLKMTGEADMDSILGLRVGEALGCIFSDVMEEGCGTSKYCGECRAVRSILKSLGGEFDIQDCRITLGEKNQALDLRVMASPMIYNDERFSVFSITDIEDEKRREVLERIFLHDVRNTAGGLKGFSSFLMEVPRGEEDAAKKVIKDLADKLLDEIDAYQQITMAEKSTLKIVPTTLRTHDILNRTRWLYLKHDVASGKDIMVDYNAADVIMKTDETILRRIIGNMTKNALEAIRSGNSVTLSCEQIDDRVRFTVHNPGLIPPDVQLQIFQRSFTTKGSGRGIGTYSIKLLSEQYLGGKVGLITSESEGTIFHADFPLNAET